MSPHLKWGEIHPRTMLADLAALRGNGAATYRTELAWREFYADVLCAPTRRRARDYYRPEFAAMEYDEPGARVRRVAARAAPASRSSTPACASCGDTGWMHNRVRMIVASFLVKDLHVEWQHGARHFMRLAASTATWPPTSTAGSGWPARGTDAAPYFRVFNPTTQGRKFDPDGDYVRRWVPELADVADPHDPSPDDRERVGYPDADRRPRRGAPRGAGPVPGDPMTAD